MAREVRLPAGTEYLSVVEAAVHIATNLHPFTPYSEVPADVIARIRYKATFETMRDKMIRMVKSQQLRTIDKFTLLTKEYQPSGLLIELDFTFDKLVDMKISLSQFIDICKDEQLSVFVDPNYHLIPPEPTPEPDSPLETVKTSDEAINKGKPRKKRIPQERDRSEGLLLINELLDCYNIDYLDELPASKAWGKIVSGEFTSELIKEIAENKKSIMLKGGEKLNKVEFLEQYRKRFKSTPEEPD